MQEPRNKDTRADENTDRPFGGRAYADNTQTIRRYMQICDNATGRGAGSGAGERASKRRRSARGYGYKKKQIYARAALALVLVLMARAGIKRGKLQRKTARASGRRWEKHTSRTIAAVAGTTKTGGRGIRGKERRGRTRTKRQCKASQSKSKQTKKKKTGRWGDADAER